MSFLRDPASATAHPRFVMLGANDPEKSTDKVGVLIGRRTIEQEDWLVFLVASVASREVRDVRVAMLSDHPANRRWLIGREDDRAVNTYNHYRESIWRKRYPERETPPINPDLFPAEDDMFRLEVAGNTVSVLEERSGARWTLVMTQRRPFLAHADDHSWVD